MTEDLQNVRNTLRKEVNDIENGVVKENEIGDRLIYLFQKDMLPGVSGLILEVKHNRDNAQRGLTTYNMKMLCWIFIVLLNCGMLFYIFLFALSQSSQRQHAWFHSFLVWLTLEILFVSTMIVCITHVLIPSLIFKDVATIKAKLLQSMRELQTENNESASDVKKRKVFNAAHYLYASTRLAELYPTLRESKIILKFSTPWPLHSYFHTVSVSNRYSKKFSFITSSVASVFIYLVKGLMNMPQPVQDLIYQIVSTSGLGYVGVLFIQMYRIHPALPFFPLIIIAIIIHLAIKSGEEKDRFSRLNGSILPLPSGPSSKLPPSNLNVHVTRQQVAPDSSDNDNPIHMTRRQSVMAAISISDQLLRRHKTINYNDLINLHQRIGHEIDNENNGSNTNYPLTSYINAFNQQENDSDSSNSSDDISEYEMVNEFNKVYKQVIQSNMMRCLMMMLQ
jgi:hypothetical protein